MISGEVVARVCLSRRPGLAEESENDGNKIERNRITTEYTRQPDSIVTGALLNKQISRLAALKTEICTEGRDAREENLRFAAESSEHS